jgi:multicomponent Na+:H+ antiporter subunit G
VIAWMLIGLGSLLIAIGTLGIVRFRDIYSRLQASGVSDNVGSVLLLVGLALLGGLGWDDAAIFLLIVLLVATNPIATHSIAKSAFTQHYKEERSRL